LDIRSKRRWAAKEEELFAKRRQRPAADAKLAALTKTKEPVDSEHKRRDPDENAPNVEVAYEEDVHAKQHDDVTYVGHRSVDGNLWLMWLFRWRDHPFLSLALTELELHVLRLEGDENDIISFLPILEELIVKPAPPYVE
jgi:hypothetical protein